jgi:hypothetical protein
MTLDGIRKLHNTTACSGGVVSLLRSPSGGMREGDDREVEVGGAPGRRESSKARGCVVYASPHVAPLYRGEGVPLPLHQGTRGDAQGGGEGRRLEARWPPTQTLTLAGRARA